MLRFFNSTTKIGYVFTIKGHCSLRIKVVPVHLSCQATAELSFINLIDINIKLQKIIYDFYNNYQLIWKYAESAIDDITGLIFPNWTEVEKVTLLNRIA